MVPTAKSRVFIIYGFLVAAASLNAVTDDVEAFSPSHYLFKSRQRCKRKNNGENLFLGGEAGRIEKDIEQHPLETTIFENGAVNPSSARTNVTLEFPSFHTLMDIKPGEYVASETFECCAPGTNKNITSSVRHKFRVKLYPRGGGGGINEPLIKQWRSEEVVGLYLQYLGLDGSKGDDNVDENDSVNVTFALRLKGRQRQQRFDVEWRAGMRFVSDAENSNLNQGDANEFGFPLMQTNLLNDFFGIVDNDQMYDPRPILVEAEVSIHDTAMEESLFLSSIENEQQSSPNANGNNSSRTTFNEDIRRRQDGMVFGHDTERVRVGKIVVPVLSRFSQRPQMFEQGTYPGVEYRILRILKDDQERFTSCPGAQYELKPVYPLVAQLERPWPVRVKEKDIPRLYTPSMYNLLSAFGSLLTAATGLFTAFLLSQAISFFVIPSKSMDPTLNVGDVLLVDKFSSRAFSRQSSRNKVGEIVLFSPPNELQQIVTRNGGNLNNRDLFVKRIAASTGDKVTVYKDGKVEVNDKNIVDGQRDLCETEPLRLIEKYIQPIQDHAINPEEVFVMGDCSSVSIDSRVWGSLQTENIVGRPIVRLWPLDRFGKVE